MATRSVVGEDNNISESIEELKMKLDAMKRIMDSDDEEKGSAPRKRNKCRESIIDGSFLSFVFILVLVLIICVSFYAFSNLYYAVLKKFPVKKHNEL